MVESPVRPHDPYMEKPKPTKVEEHDKTHIHNCDKPNFVIKSLKTDKDIKEAMHNDYSALDPSPHLPMYKAWNMRPRDRSKEVGP